MVGLGAEADVRLATYRPTDRRARTSWIGPAALAALLCAGPAQAAVFIVTNTTDAAAGSLRAAITSANGAAGADTICFGIGAGVQTINLASALPVISEAVTIDGPNIGANAGCGPETVELDGAGAGAGAIGLDVGVTGGGTHIIGLVINRFSSYGIRLTGGGNFVQGNRIGVDTGGTLARPNAVGIGIRSINNQIDGTTAAGPNVISGNTGDGIQIDGSAGAANTNTVRGNYIGLTASGLAGLGNGGAGVALFSGGAGSTAGNTIGVVGAGNVISANQHGITITNASTATTVVQANLIGTDKNGTGSIGNLNRGVSIDQGSRNNTVGGTAAGAGNTIAHNGTEGVWMGGAATNTNALLGNAIFANGSPALGIDLNANGVDNNDTGDGDGASNNTQNHPVLTAAMTNGLGSATLAGSLNSTPGITYRVEFFASVTPDPTGYGEGERYLGATNVTTGGSGNAIIAVALAAPLNAGEYVSSTATVCTNGPCTTFGDTSEFGRNVQAVGHLVVTTTADTVDGDTSSVANLIANPGADGRVSLREAITATNTSIAADTVTFGIPIADANHVYYQDNAVAGTFAAPVATTLADQSTPSSLVITNYDADYPAGTARSWYRITLGSDLPPVTSPIVLDTTTQPLSVAGTGPVVELNGAGVVATGLSMMAGSDASTIRGFVINRCTSRGILLRGSSNSVVVGNFLGTNPAGTAPGPGNNVGVYIGGGTATVTNNHRVGGTVAADRNIISGNTIDGVHILRFERRPAAPLDCEQRHRGQLHRNGRHRHGGRGQCRPGRRGVQQRNGRDEHEQRHRRSRRRQLDLRQRQRGRPPPRPRDHGDAGAGEQDRDERGGDGAPSQRQLRRPDQRHHVEQHRRGDRGGRGQPHRPQQLEQHPGQWRRRLHRRHGELDPWQLDLREHQAGDRPQHGRSDGRRSARRRRGGEQPPELPPDRRSLRGQRDRDRHVQLRRARRLVSHRVLQEPIWSRPERLRRGARRSSPRGTSRTPAAGRSPSATTSREAPATSSRSRPPRAPTAPSAPPSATPPSFRTRSRWCRPP